MTAGSVALRFHLGGVGTADLSLPFDILRQPLSGTRALPFDIAGGAGSSLSLPFDVVGPLHGDLSLLFDIIDTEGDEARHPTGGLHVPENYLPSPYEAAVVGMEPVVYWRFEEEVGASAALDSSRWQRHGAYLGTPELGVAGLLPGESSLGLKGDASGDGVATPQVLGLFTHSVAVWFRRDGQAGDGTGTPIDTYHQIAQYLMGSQGNLYVHTHGYILYQATRDSDAATMNHFGATNVSGSSTYRPFADVGSMHFLVATYDGEYMRLYVDGVESGDPLETGTLRVTRSFSARIGRTDNYRPNGVFDEAAIFDRALTHDEVVRLYAIGSRSDEIAQTALEVVSGTLQVHEAELDLP